MQTLIMNALLGGPPPSVPPSPPPAAEQAQPAASEDDKRSEAFRMQILSKSFKYFGGDCRGIGRNIKQQLLTTVVSELEMALLNSLTLIQIDQVPSHVCWLPFVGVAVCPCFVLFLFS